MNQNADRRDFILRLATTAAALCALPAGAQGVKPAATQTILVVGDSLSAEYGLARGKGWVALLEARLAAQKVTANVVNASISGDTTSGGRSRLAPLLKQHKPSVVVIELGGNDALRGLPLKNTKENLAWMTTTAQQAGAKVLLLGMQVPPNYGRNYSNQFAQIFVDVAQEKKAAVVPFLLKGIADKANAADAAALFQVDRIHPRAEAHPQILDNVWSALRKILR